MLFSTFQYSWLPYVYRLSARALTRNSFLQRYSKEAHYTINGKKIVCGVFYWCDTNYFKLFFLWTIFSEIVHLWSALKQCKIFINNLYVHFKEFCFKKIIIILWNRFLLIRDQSLFVLHINAFFGSITYWTIFAWYGCLSVKTKYCVFGTT